MPRFARLPSSNLLNHPSAKGQRGFTLVELVLVTVIVGVLAAVAAPRLFNLSKDARIAAAQGVESAVRGQVNLLQMKCMTVAVCRDKVNETNQATAPVTPDASNGLLIGMVYGVPRQTTLHQSLTTLLNVSEVPGYASKGELGGFLVEVSSGSYDAGGSITFTRKDATDPTNCKVVYEPGKWGTDGWTAPWNSNYRGGGSGNLPTVPLDQRYNVSTTTTGC